MQAYFDRHDAHLEFESLVSRIHTRTESKPDAFVQASYKRQLADILILGLALTILTFVIAAQLGSVAPDIFSKIEDAPKILTKFIVEIPPKEKPKPKVEPKKEIIPPKPQPEERLRAIPDTRTITERNPIVEKTREHKVDDVERDVKSEKTADRSLPAVQTPILAVEATAREDVSSDNIRYAAVETSRNMGGGRYTSQSTGPDRELPSENISRVKLDPYHYQMVNICLRLCAKTMFTHSGVSADMKEVSKGWLRIDGASAFSFKYGGEWHSFKVNKNYLSDIANLNYIEFPYSMQTEARANEIAEDVTRRLCSLLGYDDCLEQL